MLNAMMSQALSEWTKSISGKVSKGWISELYFNSINNLRYIVKQQQKTMSIFVFGTDWISGSSFLMIVIIYMLTWKVTHKYWTSLSLSNLQASM